MNDALLYNIVYALAAILGAIAFYIAFFRLGKS